MLALLWRNIKIYFANVPGAIMSCLGALISFFIYIGFLQKVLKGSWSGLPSATKVLDLWMIAGIVAIAGITTSFQALGQLVRDRETRTADDIMLTNISALKQNCSYVLSSTIISFIMQVITFAVMAVYFTAVDQVQIPTAAYLPILLFIALGAVCATLLNEIIVIFINSSTTFSRLSALISAVAGFAVATYMPYGTLSPGAQTLVKLVPSSYEAAALRKFLLAPIFKARLTANVSNRLSRYLGINLKLSGHQLTQGGNALVMLGMSIILLLIIIVISVITTRKRIGQSENQFSK